MNYLEDIPCFSSSVIGDCTALLTPLCTVTILYIKQGHPQKQFIHKIHHNCHQLISKPNLQCSLCTHLHCYSYQQWANEEVERTAPLNTCTITDKTKQTLTTCGHQLGTNCVTDTLQGHTEE